MIVAEAIDRLSRDQEDIAHIYQCTRLASVRIVRKPSPALPTRHGGRDRCEDRYRGIPAPRQRGGTAQQSLTVDTGRGQTATVIDNQTGAGHFLRQQRTEECPQVKIAECPNGQHPRSFNAFPSRSSCFRSVVRNSKTFNQLRLAYRRHRTNNLLSIRDRSRHLVLPRCL